MGAAVVRPVKVSVIVAMYNTGPMLLDLIASLDRQTIASSDFEVVLVDDGSTDDTLRIAQEAACTRPHLVVESIPNSGWPGRPRNVGIDLAHGEYVFFSDHDDALGPRALASLHAFAEENGSDIVCGKVVRTGRPTPYWPMWKRDVPAADLTGPVISSRTVHKLFRRRFLLEHHLRFREGRVRLEDHEFMARALPRAGVVSILASEPCYFWRHRRDGSNASDDPVPDEDYWGDYGRALAAWEQAAGPGPLLEAARTISIRQAFSRFPPATYLARDPQGQDSVVAGVGHVIREHFPADLDERLPLLKRSAVMALREGDRGLLTRVQEFRRTSSTELVTTLVGDRDGRLLVRVLAELAWAPPPGGGGPGDAGRVTPAVPTADPLEVEPSGREQLRLPWDGGGACPLGPEDLGGMEITIRHRANGIEWPVPVQRRVEMGTARAGPHAAVAVEAEVDTQRDAFGEPLTPGTWDVLARISFLGEGSIRRVPVPRGGFSLPPGESPTASAYATRSGTLAFEVPRTAVLRAQWRDAGLALVVPGAIALEFGPRGGSEVTAIPVVDGRALCDVASLVLTGIVDVWAADVAGGRSRLAYTGGTQQTTIGDRRVLAYATAHGSLSIRATPSR